MNPSLSLWNCTTPPPSFQVNLAHITVPEPYIYVTNNTGNRAILERCSGSPAVLYADDTMPTDAIGCVLVAHVEKGSAAEAWQCFMDGRLEGQWGVMEKDRTNGVGKRGAGVVMLGLLVVSALFVGL